MKFQEQNGNSAFILIADFLNYSLIFPKEKHLPLLFISGGETGKIEVKGGSGDATYGGGGAGGRIAVYHVHDIDAQAGYRGEYNTEGGASAAEPGASGKWVRRH